MTQYAVVNWEGEMAPIVKKGVGVEEKYVRVVRAGMCDVMRENRFSLLFVPAKWKKVGNSRHETKINSDY
jgi:hypothetical protein